MSTQNIAELLVSIGSVAIPLIAAFFGKYIAKYLKSNKIAATIATLATQAVIEAQKLGVTTYLTGAIKNSKAIVSVESALKSLGFTTKEIESLASTIKSAIETEYATLTNDGTLSVYTQKTETEEATETATKLAAAKKELAEAQAAVTALESTATSETASTSAANSTATK